MFTTRTGRFKSTSSAVLIEKLNFFRRRRLIKLIKFSRFGLGLCCLTPLLTIFQLYRGGNFIGKGN